VIDKIPGEDFFERSSTINLEVHAEGEEFVQNVPSILAQNRFFEASGNFSTNGRMSPSLPIRTSSGISEYYGSNLIFIPFSS